MSWLVVPVVLYVGFTALLYVFQGRLLYFPTRALETEPGAFGLEFEEVELETAGGIRIHAWHVPAPNARGTVVFCHGNAGNISHRVGTLARFHEWGLSTLIFDYPGYGKSGGTPSEQGTYAAAEAVYQHVTGELAVPPTEIVIWGRSLGGTIAVELASRHETGALVLESTMSSVVDVAKRHYWYLPVGLLCRYRHDAQSRIAGIRAPKLFVHSKEDEIVPFEFGRRLFDAASEPKQLVELTGNHNGYIQSSGERYTARVAAFLDAVLGSARKR